MYKPYINYLSTISLPEALPILNSALLLPPAAPPGHLLQPLEPLRPVLEGTVQAAHLCVRGRHAAVHLLDVTDPGTGEVYQWPCL